MAYAKSPASASGSPAAVNKSPAAISLSPADAVYTEVPTGISAPVADAGPDAGHNRMYAAAYQLAGSATGSAPITYLWEKVSGTPTVAFADDTDPLTTATFIGVGAIVLKLTATNAVGSDDDEVTLTITEAGLLDGMASAPRACGSDVERMLAAYTGPLQRIRMTTGGDVVTEHDVPYAAADDRLDTADRAAFVGSESWVVVTTYDQTAGARNLTNATAANQPLGGTTGTGVELSSQPASDYDGASDRLVRADALGLSGAIALTLWVDCSFDAVTGLPIAIGTNGAGQLLYINENSNVLPKVATSGAERAFTSASLTDGNRKRLIARIGAGAGIGTSRLMLNGTELVESATINPANTVTLGTAATAIGSYVTAAAFQNGKIQRWGFWNADLAAGDLTIVNAVP